MGTTFQDRRGRQWVKDREDKGHPQPTPNNFTLSHFLLLSPLKRKFSFCNVKPVLCPSCSLCWSLILSGNTREDSNRKRTSGVHCCPSGSQPSSYWLKLFQRSSSWCLPFWQLSVLWTSHRILIKNEQSNRGWWLSLMTAAVNTRNLQAHTGSEEAMRPAQSSLWYRTLPSVCFRGDKDAHGLRRS